MRFCTAIALAASILVWPSIARAERPPQERADADVVLRGQVEAVAESWDLETDYYTVLVRVEAVDRGPGIAPGEIFAITCFRWSRPWPGKVGGSGHTGVPHVGDQVQVYAFRQGSGYEGAYPDWYDVLRPTARGWLARLWDSRKIRVAAVALLALGLIVAVWRSVHRRHPQSAPAALASETVP